MSSVWPATCATILSLRAPTYCAMSVEPASDRPEPMAKVRNRTGKLIDTAATAAPPSRPTQKASMIW